MIRRYMEQLRLSLPATRLSLVRVLEQYALPVLALATASYALLFAVAAVYKYHAFWMGFDLSVHEQLLWNTTHGRIAAVSMFGTTDSYFGIDIIIVELLLAPLYALLPRTETMLVLQTTIAATGAVPLYLLATERTGQPRYGLLMALLYFATLPVQYAILYEFQIRTAGTVFFLWAFLFYEQRRLGWFLLLGLLAIWTRSDGGLTLAAIGLYALIERRPWQWVVLPAALGMGWLVLCVRVLIPAFRAEHDFLYSLIYAWLGDSPGAMLTTFVTRPGFVFSNIVTPDKLLYLLDLFAPLLFLPLLRPSLLLIAAPTIALNLLSLDRIHWSIRYHYQAFAVPFLLIATLYAFTAAQSARPAAAAPHRPWLARYAPQVALALVGAALVAQVWLRSPLISLATRDRDTARIALAHEMLQLVPPDASLSITSTLGPHAARREHLYFFPGNVIYPPELAANGQYLLADTTEIPAPDQPRFAAVLQDPAWQVRAQRGDFILLERAAP